MEDLDVEQISNILFHQLDQDEVDFIYNNFSISQAMLTIGNKQFRDEVVDRYKKYLEFLDKLDKLHRQAVCGFEVITH